MTDTDTTTETKRVVSCAEESCQEPAADFVRYALTTPTGSMTVEVLLCVLHISSAEMETHGSFLYVRPRHRLDLNGH